MRCPISVNLGGVECDCLEQGPHAHHRFRDRHGVRHEFAVVAYPPPVVVTELIDTPEG